MLKIVSIQARKAQDQQIAVATSEVAVDVMASRKRSSAFCEAGSSPAASKAPKGGIATVFEAVSAVQLSTAIAKFINCEGLAFTLSRSPLLINILGLARSAPPSYLPPPRMAVGTTYLTASSNRQDRISARLIWDNARYGYSVLSNGCRANKTPLVSILAGLPNMLPPPLPLIDCTDHMAEGDIKDGVFLHSSAIVDGYSY